MLDFTGSVTILRPSRSKYDGRTHEASCRRGTGAAPASEGRRSPRPRAVLGQPRRPLGAGPVRPRSKAERQRCRVGAPQGAGVTLHAQGSAIQPALEQRTPGPVWRNPGHASLRRAIPLDFRGRRKKRKEGDPLAQSRKQGPILFCLLQLQCRRDRSCRVGKGVGTAFNMNERLAYAVPTNSINASRTIHGGHGAR